MATSERLSVVTPADWIPGPEQGSWTYANYTALPDDGQRYEIVNGVLLTTPSPKRRLLGRLTWSLKLHLLVLQPLTG